VACEDAVATVNQEFVSIFVPDSLAQLLQRPEKGRLKPASSSYGGRKLTMTASDGGECLLGNFHLMSERQELADSCRSRSHSPHCVLPGWAERSSDPD
jgi:hypothetical protein